MDRNKGVITFESLQKNSALLGLQDMSDDDLRYMVKEVGRTCAGSVSLRQSQSLNDGESLSSEVGMFELGFFSPGSSKDRFLGIWYKNIPVRTVVWVANRNTPIRDRTGELTINSTGSVVVTSRISGDIWSTSSFTNAKAPVLQLLDSGNFILRDEKGSNSDVYLWQSFDYPFDTLLPGMKFGWDLRTGLNRQLSLWRNSDDPSPGELSNGIELHEYPQAVIWKGSRKYFHGSPWTGDKFSGAPELRVNPVFDHSFISNKDEVYYIYQLKNKSVISRLVLNDTSSSRQRYVWVEAGQAWRLYASVPCDYCDTYSLFGANGVCVMKDKKLDVLWFGDLIDIRQIPNGGQDLYIRIEASGQGASQLLFSLTAKRRVVKAVSISLITAAVLSVLVFLCYYLSRRKKKDKGVTEGPKGDLELPFFDLATVAHADNFSVNNKLGEGGFGPVYKGTLEDGQQITVKRLSKSSGQGLNELKNEVKLIAKLQHRNLVKLIGSCIDDEEKMLIYEYMANGSLDSFVFDQTRWKQLGWSKFFQIIGGIARDHGYMAPEYGLYGLFSVKSDVFSFGVLLLEIVTGQKNGCFHHPHQHHNLIGYAWRMWIEGRPLELADDSSSFEDSSSMLEISRCIHVSLLCVQQRPEDRPNISAVVLMLNGESSLPQPKHPGFLIDMIPTEFTSSRPDSCTANQITFSSFEAR
ncbi:hypothetical protein P3S67_020454 [Capsicum chacoense]